MEAIKRPLLKDIVIFALNTGLRKKKILSLKWSNVDFETKCIILESFETKTKKRHVLLLNSRAWQVIKMRFKQRVEKCSYVFHRNGKKINSIRTAFENTLKRARIKNFHFYNLRYTFASYFLLLYGRRKRFFEAIICFFGIAELLFGVYIKKQ